MMRQLHRLQNEINRRRNKMLHMDYQGGNTVKASWQVNRKEVDAFRDRMLNRQAALSLGLDEAYAEAALAWGEKFESIKQDIRPYQFNRIRPIANELERIRMQLRPVREALVAEKVQDFRRKRLWTRHLLRDLVTKDIVVGNGTTIIKCRAPEITQRFNRQLLSTPAPSMIFRRYPRLGGPETKENMLVNSLLKKPRTLASKFSQARAICDDSWVINLRQNEKRNTLMDSYFRTIRQPQQEMKAVDVSQELMDLMKIYSDAHEQLSTRERYAHSSLVDVMRTYLEVFDERKMISEKLSTLKSKIIDPNCQHDEEDEDEGDDE